MNLTLTLEAMQKWRKEAEDFLGFPLQIPKYSKATFFFGEYLAPVWNYGSRFYDSQDNVICKLTSHERFLFTDDQTGIPGVPDTWGSDEDWWNLFYSRDYAPVFKGFPWNFTLTFYDNLHRPVKEIVARRSLQNDSRPTIHMTLYLDKWNYYASGESKKSHTCQYFSWELP